MYGKARVPLSLWVFIFVALVLTFIGTPNFLITVLIMFYIPFAYRLFFIKNNSNILFWGLMYQWATVSLQVIYCNILGIPLNELFKDTVFPADLMEYTDFLSVTGIYIFTLGMFLVMRKTKVSIPDELWEKYDPRKLMQTYVIVSVIISTTQVAIWAFPGLVQYFFFLFYIKWGFFIVMFISVFKRAPELKIFLLLIIAVEFVLGISSFFASSFTNILLFSIIAYSAVNEKISYRKGIFFGIMTLLLFHMAVLWTASKRDYRTYLNEGQMTQTVNVSKEAARAKLLELIVKIDAETYNKAIEDMINRIGYIQYFSAAIRYVPARVPHEGGKVYLAAISHYLVPRFINPDKPKLDDSRHTNQYTGLGVSDSRRGSSFSLGSFADAYIDFGPVLMFIPIFMFGYLLGYLFRYLYRRNIWGLIFTGPFFLLINIFGTDTTKALGFCLIYFIVMAVLNRYIVNFIDPLIRYTKRE